MFRNHPILTGLLVLLIVWGILKTPVPAAHTALGILGALGRAGQSVMTFLGAIFQGSGL